VVLAVWVVRGLLEAATPALRAAERARLGYGADAVGWAPWVTGFVLAVVSGLFIRWLLERRRESLRLDIGLVAYVMLLEAASLSEWAILQLLRPDRHSMGRHEVLSRALLLAPTTLIVGLIYAAVALWPIALLVGDRLSLPAAVRRMAPTYGWWVLTVVLLALPGLALGQFGILVLHQMRPDSTMRFVSIAISSLATTLSTVVLSQVYARQVRGGGVVARGARAAG
jgi:hypothetical protein